MEISSDKEIRPSNNNYNQTILFIANSCRRSLMLQPKMSIDNEPQQKVVVMAAHMMKKSFYAQAPRHREASTDVRKNLSS